jgi:hypothetical protein
MNKTYEVFSRAALRTHTPPSVLIQGISIPSTVHRRSVYILNSARRRVSQATPLGLVGRLDELVAAVGALKATVEPSKHLKDLLDGQTRNVRIRHAGAVTHVVAVAITPRRPSNRQRKQRLVAVKCEFVQLPTHMQTRIVSDTNSRRYAENAALTSSVQGSQLGKPKRLIRRNHMHLWSRSKSNFEQANIAIFNEIAFS